MVGRFAEFSRAQLAVLVPELLLCGHLIDRSGMQWALQKFGHAGMVQVAVDEWMAASPIGSPMLKAREPLVLDLPDEAWFDVDLMQKDIRLAEALAEELGVPLSTATVADEWLIRARERGYEHRDIAALYETLRYRA